MVDKMADFFQYGVKRRLTFKFYGAANRGNTKQPPNDSTKKSLEFLWFECELQGRNVLLFWVINVPLFQCTT